MATRARFRALRGAPRPTPRSRQPTRGGVPGAPQPHLRTPRGGGVVSPPRLRRRGRPPPAAPASDPEYDSTNAYDPAEDAATAPTTDSAAETTPPPSSSSFASPPPSHPYPRRRRRRASSPPSRGEASSGGSAAGAKNHPQRKRARRAEEVPSPRAAYEAVRAAWPDEATVAAHLAARLAELDEQCAAVAAHVGGMPEAADAAPLLLALMGSSGCGKTATVDALEELVGAAHTLRLSGEALQLDDYSADVTGAPAGTVGYDDGRSVYALVRDLARRGARDLRGVMLVVDEFCKMGDAGVRALMRVLDTGTVGGRGDDVRVPYMLVVLVGNYGEDVLSSYYAGLRATVRWVDAALAAPGTLGPTAAPPPAPAGTGAEEPEFLPAPPRRLTGAEVAVVIRHEIREVKPAFISGRITHTLVGYQPYAPAQQAGVVARMLDTVATRKAAAMGVRVRVAPDAVPALAAALAAGVPAGEGLRPLQKRADAVVGACVRAARARGVRDADVRVRLAGGSQSGGGSGGGCVALLAQAGVGAGASEWLVHVRVA